MQEFLTQIKSKAAQNPKKIVFPEGDEIRILQACSQILKEKTALPILLGNRQKIEKQIQSNNIEIDLDKIEIVDSENSQLTEKFATEFIELRKSKGAISMDQALNTMRDINYFGTMMVHADLAAGMVSGTRFSTAETIRPALQIIKTKEPFHKVSGLFVMIMEERLMLFADTAVNVEPNSHELADIACDTIKSAQHFGIDPKVAMLSFSTNHSAKHPLVDKVREATAIANHKCPNHLIEGELQVDAAIIEEVALRKSPNSKLQGRANILIFPDLQSGNIAYKLVERLAKAKAIGPILQGLKKPVNDLSRGCSFEDIVGITAITVCEAQEDFGFGKTFNSPQA